MLLVAVGQRRKGRGLIWGREQGRLGELKVWGDGRKKGESKVSLLSTRESLFCEIPDVSDPVEGRSKPNFPLRFQQASEAGAQCSRCAHRPALSALQTTLNQTLAPSKANRSTHLVSSLNLSFSTNYRSKR